MLNQAELNGVEMNDAYGVTFINGLKNLESPPPLKTAIEKIWPEEKGRQYRFNPNTDDFNASLDCLQSGSDMADFLSKKSALLSVLEAPNLQILYVFTTGVEYVFKYNRVSNFEFVNISSGVGATFTLDITVTVGTQPDTIIILDGNG